MITECINEDCYEFTENIGGLCPVCMGLAQKRADAARKAGEARKVKYQAKAARFEWAEVAK